MARPLRWCALALVVLLVTGSSPAPAEEVVPSAIVCAQGKDASFAERLAAKEIRRYVYLRTGQLLPLVDRLEAKAEGGLIVVGLKSRPAVAALLTDPTVKTTVTGLAAEQYLIKAVQHGGRPVILVAGGDPIGTLYGAYRLAEQLGVRFYLHGDVVPDERIAAGRCRELDESGQAAVRPPRHPAVPRLPRRARLVERRRLQGDPRPAAQAADELLRPAHVSRGRRRARSRRCGSAGPSDIGPDGRVKFSYPSRHFTTLQRHLGLRADEDGRLRLRRGGAVRSRRLRRRLHDGA